MTDCMFHSGDDCPAARELADPDRQIDLRMKAEAESKRLLANALIDNVVNTSDEDILQEVLADSGNSDHESNIVRGIIKGIKTTKQSALNEQERFERLSELMADKGVRHEAFELLADLHPARIRAKARAEALKEAADRAVKFCHDIFPWGSDGSHAENLRAAITQEE
jgi:hypothetical protein